MDAIDRDTLTVFFVTFVAYGLGRAGLLPHPSSFILVLLAVVFILAAAGL